MRRIARCYNDLAAHDALADGKRGAMLQYLFYILLAAAVAGAGYVAYLFAQGYFTGSPMGGGLFGPKPEKRIDVVEQSNLDGRRRLVLIRRDDVEHLIMTGGPVDVVIETNIAAPRRETDSRLDADGAGRARPARVFGQASGEK